MSEGVKGGRIPNPADFRAPSLVDEQTPTGARRGKSHSGNKPLDQFERAQSSGNSVVQGAAAKSLVQGAAAAQTGRPAFSSEEMAALASAFAAVIRQHPSASRLERAKYFSRAVLKRSKLKKLFGKLSEAQLEAMCDGIGDALGDSPVFGQLVDSISEEAGRPGS